MPFVLFNEMEYSKRNEYVYETQEATNLIYKQLKVHSLHQELDEHQSQFQKHIVRTVKGIKCPPPLHASLTDGNEMKNNSMMISLKMYVQSRPLSHYPAAALVSDE